MQQPSRGINALAPGLRDMRILINGKACETCGRKEDSDARLSKQIGPSEGRVLSGEEAQAAAESAANDQREKLILWSAAIFLVVVVMLAIMGSYAARIRPREPRDLAKAEQCPQRREPGPRRREPPTPDQTPGSAADCR